MQHYVSEFYLYLLGGIDYCLIDSHFAIMNLLNARFLFFSYKKFISVKVDFFYIIGFVYVISVIALPTFFKVVCNDRKHNCGKLQSYNVTE